MCFIASQFILAGDTECWPSMIRDDEVNIVTSCQFLVGLLYIQCYR